MHDIGKIYVPIEILNKPCKLTKIEMSLIKTHSEVGNDILKAIPFSYPIAEIVYQHHERIDGSGYPLSLTERDILFEAKILMVADVVEAMATHRPYRPSLGVETALHEITSKKNISYDGDIVDACRNVLLEKHFEFNY